MVPLRDHNPTRRTAFFTLLFLLANVAVFVFLQPRGDSEALVSIGKPKSFGQRPVSEDVFIFWQAAIPCEIVKNQPLDQNEINAAVQGKSSSCSESTRSAPVVFPEKRPLLSILTSMFLHGGWLHLIGNMLFLWIFGNNVEDRFGRVGFVAFYLAAGLVATAAHVAADPNSVVPLVGASGAIAGVMGAYLVLFPKAKITSVLAFLPIIAFRVPAWALLAIWFGSQFFVNPNDGVAWIAHVGGFMFGVLVAFGTRNIGSEANASWVRRKEGLR